MTGQSKRKSASRRKQLKGLVGLRPDGVYPAGWEPKIEACTYDWQDGYVGERLACVTQSHNHAEGATTVIRIRWKNHDTLRELGGLGMLVGQAEEKFKEMMRIEKVSDFVDSLYI